MAWYDNLSDAETVSVSPDGKTSQAPEMSNTDLAFNLARAIGQGLTFGFADEAEGYARSILGDETYTEARDSARDQTHPVSYTHLTLPTNREV